MSISRMGTLSGGMNTLHSEQIREEIRRFESVHPCIYQIYDLIEYIENPTILAQIRDQVVCIEDAFVNSQEWTMSRSISELKLGVVGAGLSGKTALIHRYLTGVFASEESPEGGRFKKEVVIDGQSHLLLIRDEGDGYPDAQFSLWADAVIFVFSVDSPESFEKVRHFYTHMSKFRDLKEMPFLLVGTKDTVNDANPRVVTEDEGRQMAVHLRRCTYYETCATYGLNVERVFKDACSKIIQQRLKLLGANSARTPTPTTPATDRNYQDARFFGSTSKGTYQHHQRSLSSVPGQEPMHLAAHGNGPPPTRPKPVFQQPINPVYQRDGTSLSSGVVRTERSQSAFAVPLAQPSSSSHFDPRRSPKAPRAVQNGTRSSAALLDVLDNESPLTTGPLSVSSASTSHLPTPASTPTTQRKNRRISNIFRGKEHTGNEEKTSRALADLNMGVGRAIPVKQGLLYKKSSKALNKEWKKKYVCLYSDGRLSYHQSLKDYMDKDGHAKEIFLALATVRMGGRTRPRATQRSQTQPISTMLGKENKRESLEGDKGYDGARRSDVGVEKAGSGETSAGASDDASRDGNFASASTPQTVPGKKKKGGHRRLGTGSRNDNEDEEFFEVVSHDGKRWEFSAQSCEERDEWVAAIEAQIEKALQAQLAQPCNSTRVTGERHEVQALRAIPGNDRCADCGSPQPDWASLNLGTLVCIECSGVHRQLGSHISRVRSLELDEWPVEYLAVMHSLGNDEANRVWEHNAPRDKKPQPESSREAKEAWIRAKYEARRFLPALRVDTTLSQQLIDAVLRKDVPALVPLLARASASDVNSPISSADRRTPLHLACSIGSVEIVQILLWYNADMRVLDEKGHSVLWYAKNCGAKDCVAVLVNAGLPSDYGIPPSRDDEGRDERGSRAPPPPERRSNLDALPASFI